jgi:hypothetical protein
VRLTNRIKQAGATGYILLWLLGIPIPILLLIFCSEGAHKDFGSALALVTAALEHMAQVPPRAGCAAARHV